MKMGPMNRGLLAIFVFFLATSDVFAANTDLVSNETLAKCHLTALALKNASKYQESEALFRLILSVDPADMDALFDLGNVYLLQKRYTDAVACHKKAWVLRFEKDFMCTYYFNLALDYRGLGKMKEANKFMALPGFV